MIRISVFRKELVRKVPVRLATRITIPGNSTAVVEIKMARPLPQNQDYLYFYTQQAEDNYVWRSRRSPCSFPPQPAFRTFHKR
jgi:hypothetical protein